MPPDEYDYVVAAIDDAPLEYYVVQNIALGLVAEIRRIKKEHRPLVDLVAEMTEPGGFPLGFRENAPPGEVHYCHFCTWNNFDQAHDDECWHTRAVKALEAYRGR